MWGTVVRISEIYEHHFVVVGSSIWTIGRLSLGSAPQEPNIPGIRIEGRDRDLWFARDAYLTAVARRKFEYDGRSFIPVS